MIEKDTIKLLRECDAGVKMGVDSINEVLSFVQADSMRNDLTSCRAEHELLQAEIRSRLRRFKDKGKEPSPVASGMSRMKTDLALLLKGSDSTIAGLMTDGCSMGVKSLNRYLNQYKAADEISKDITKRLIHLEERLQSDMREYL